MTVDERTRFLRSMRGPCTSFLALICLLAINVALGATMPFGFVWIIELAIALVMAAVILLFSMEALAEPPIIRLFSVIGFCWLCILISMTLSDYLTR